MQTHIILLQVAAILIAARVFAELATRLKIPAIIGELCAGIVLGPSLPGWITPNEIIGLLAEIGIILLLFEVGLGTDINRLIRAEPRASVVALAGFVLPFLFGFLSSYFIFKLPLIVAPVIDGTLTATSIGITIRVLSDLGREHSREGQIVLGAAVIDDLPGVFLLAVLYEFAASGSVTLYTTGKIMLSASLFFIIAPILAKLLTPLIKHFHLQSQVPGMIPTVLVALVLIFAAIAHGFGAPHLLGGFVAGIALSRRFFLPFGVALNVDPAFTVHTQQIMKPVIQLFTPIFFVMVGLSPDLTEVKWDSLFI